MGNQTNTGRFVVAQFCDDIRQEVGNKFSLMGCYGDQVIVEKFPIVLPKFCAHIRVFTPIDRPFARLVVRAKLNTEIAAESMLPLERITPSHLRASQDNNLGRATLVAVIVLSPFVVTETSKLQIEAETEDEIIPGSFVIIREQAPRDAPNDSVDGGQ
ncbi:MAG: hypothetical protein M0T84_00135 [Betaproteobacteria bacterium]|nr:hypothetical protein [Betaproteobacteria bacterium]